MADDPEHDARNPQLQAQADSGGQRAVSDRYGARRTAQQNRLGQRAMQRHLEAVREGVRGTHTTAPPEKLKRSEEHTSELQSPCNLVCRLLLGKKKKPSRQRYVTYLLLHT